MYLFIRYIETLQSHTAQFHFFKQSETIILHVCLHIKLCDVSKRLEKSN